MTPRPVKKKGRPHKISMGVVGMQHRVTKTTREMIERYIGSKPISCQLVREPDNPADRNAVKVMIDEGNPYAGLHIGYIARQVAEVLAPALDRGQGEILGVTLFSVDPEDGEGEIIVTFRQVGKFRLNKPKNGN